MMHVTNVVRYILVFIVNLLLLLFFALILQYGGIGRTHCAAILFCICSIYGGKVYDGGDQWRYG